MNNYSVIVPSIRKDTCRFIINFKIAYKHIQPLYNSRGIQSFPFF